MRSTDTAPSPPMDPLSRFFVSKVPFMLSSPPSFVLRPHPQFPSPLSAALRCCLLICAPCVHSRLIWRRHGQEWGHEAMAQWFMTIENRNFFWKYGYLWVYKNFLLAWRRVASWDITCTSIHSSRISLKPSVEHRFPVIAENAKGFRTTRIKPEKIQHAERLIGRSGLAGKEREREREHTSKFDVLPCQQALAVSHSFSRSNTAVLSCRVANNSCARCSQKKWCITHLGLFFMLSEPCDIRKLLGNSNNIIIL